jgi:membrane AbrB-like protein
MGAQWAILLIVSAAFVLVLELLRLPAALLLGPMAAAILMAALDGKARVPRPLFYAAQAVVGCLIARGLPPSIFGEMQHDWPLFVTAIAAVVGAGLGMGWLMARWQVLPGTTAIWGALPGGATVTVLMAEAYGADIRLVAFMQYLRVVMVATVASIVSALWTFGSGSAPSAVVWFPAVAWVPFAETLGIAGVGLVIGRTLRIPAGQLLVPLVMALILQDAGLVTIELPPWLLAMSYALVGWSIGMRFSRGILVHAARALPRVAAGVASVIALSGVLAALLVIVAGVDPLTAYLATSPGGADSVAIIAASTQVDMPFVMSMQAARLAIVLVLGPSLLRFLANRVSR